MQAVTRAACVILKSNIMGLAISSHWWRLATVAILSVTSLWLGGAAIAKGAAPVQNYSATSRLDRGTIVTLNDQNTVVAASGQSEQSILGVVVDRNSLSIHLSSRGLKNETYVATEGNYPMLVSTQNGEIESGDYVTLSAIDGVAMKADTRQATVVGRAQGVFAGGKDSLTSAELKDDKGRVVQRVDIGLLSVTIDVEKNPNIISTKADVPPFLERLGQQIAEKKVSPIRIYLSIAITGISLITALVILITGVRQSILSIGRNPLSKKSIFRALIQVILTSFIILIIGLFAVYLLLRL